MLFLADLEGADILIKCTSHFFFPEIIVRNVKLSYGYRLSQTTATATALINYNCPACLLSVYAVCPWLGCCDGP